ncbi:MAG: type II toxin-antitoxin system PemK/MazF family toxin, partial [Mycobacterium sp.]
GAGTRPCVVVSADRFNRLPIRQAIVVPSTKGERGFPHHISVTDAGATGRAGPCARRCEPSRYSGSAPDYYCQQRNPSVRSPSSWPSGAPLTTDVGKPGTTVPKIYVADVTADSP